MSKIQRASWRSPLTILSAIAVAMAGVSVVANTRPAVVQAAPTVVGLVDLQKLVEGLEEVKTQNIEVQKRAKELQAQLDAMVKDYDAAKSAYEGTPPNDKNKFERGVKAQSLGMMVEANTKGLKAALAFEKGRYWKLLYPRITSSIEQLATQQGIDLIILDDRGLELPMDKELTDEQITGFLQSKKIWYAKNTVDVTAQLIDVMNNTQKGRR